MPQAANMINLGFLSDSERELILEVLRRDEDLRLAEEQRVRWAAEILAGLGWAIVRKRWPNSVCRVKCRKLLLIWCSDCYGWWILTHFTVSYVKTTHTHTDALSRLNETHIIKWKCYFAGKKQQKKYCCRISNENQLSCLHQFFQTVPCPSSCMPKIHLYWRPCSRKQIYLILIYTFFHAALLLSSFSTVL